MIDNHKYPSNLHSTSTCPHLLPPGI